MNNPYQIPPQRVVPAWRGGEGQDLLSLRRDIDRLLREFDDEVLNVLARASDLVVIRVCEAAVRFVNANDAPAHYQARVTAWQELCHAVDDLQEAARLARMPPQQPTEGVDQ